MNICLPIEQDEGLQSRVCAHFGSAPAFLIVDTETRSCKPVTNTNRHDGHGLCAPLQSLQGQAIDAMVVGGIGQGALNRLSASNICVYLSEHGTVADTLAALEAGTLRRMEPGMACASHGHGR
jgi:predicted Fe-Mo cluster-binding NifX family protein